jgi:hypothetical protein
MGAMGIGVKEQKKSDWSGKAAHKTVSSVTVFNVYSICILAFPIHHNSIPPPNPVI